MSNKPKGSILGGALLIAGSCIGAGMLGLPIITGIAGFFPSLVMFFAAWLFMTTTGLFLVEIDTWFERPVHLGSMVGHTLGVVGKVLTLILYLFLFYALLVAYIAESGHHVSALFDKNMPVWAGSLFFVLLFGWFIYKGTKQVDFLNRFLMAGKIITYVGVVIIGFWFIQPKGLFHSEIKFAFFTIPVLIISFGFHNMIPTLSHYLGRDPKRVKYAILTGSCFTLVVYLIWQIVALGILPLRGPNSIYFAYKKGVDAAQVLGDFVNSSGLGGFAFSLAFFAILTSFLAQALSLVHFLADSFRVKKSDHEHPGLCLLALIPSLILAMTFENIFYQALNFAGGICAVILFGVFPALMILIGRYKKKEISTYRVPGGIPVVILVLIFAIFIFFYQLSQTFGWNLFPTP